MAIQVYAFDSAKTRELGDITNAVDRGTATNMDELNTVRNTSTHPYDYIAYWSKEEARWLSYAEAQALMGDTFWIDFQNARKGL